MDSNTVTNAFTDDSPPIRPAFSTLEGQYLNPNHSILDSSTSKASLGEGPMEQYLNPSSLNFFDTSISEADEASFFERPMGSYLYPSDSIYDMSTSEADPEAASSESLWKI